jgi:hypothetical protein
MYDTFDDIVKDFDVIMELDLDYHIRLEAFFDELQKRFGLESGEVFSTIKEIDRSSYNSFSIYTFQDYCHEYIIESKSKDYENLFWDIYTWLNSMDRVNFVEKYYIDEQENHYVVGRGSYVIVCERNDD